MKWRIASRAALRAIQLTLVLAIGTSCVGHSRSRVGPVEVIVDERSSGSTVFLHPGDRLIVSLAGNPSTGFNWALASGADRVLVQQGEPVFTRSSNALGAGGRYRFNFSAAATGKVPLTFVYRRPFEAASPPAAIFNVAIEVLE